MPGQSNQLGARCQGERTHTRVHVYIAGYNIELYLIILDMLPSLFVSPKKKKRSKDGRYGGC
jgi:hypothetical protein